jgi:tetratricopeptide (TPR) repeat protein
VPGTVALRSLGDHLFLPADADLEPRLLPDEAAGLTHRQGLLFLPGDRVHGFDPGRPLRPADLVAMPHAPRPTPHSSRPGWQPLPHRQESPDRLREVVLDRPAETPETILSLGGQETEQDPPRPPETGPVAEIAGRTAAGAGQGLLWLGKLLGWRALAGLGARLIDQAVRQVPRVSETILGRQEAALRELLRQFREGNLEEALRRALPLGTPGGRGGTVAKDAQLPWHNLFYNLGDLLGGSNRPASVWLGAANVRVELETEYRKAAEAATRQGDYRRAAFIYGKLLQDYRLAAEVLARGGLHHDAAVIHLEKLGDPLAAARCFEAGGEIDRALQLYRQRNEHLLAGDLLRRVGEDEQALAEYRQAADRLVAEQNHLAAGELFLQRVRRSDLALEYFNAGWAARPQGTSLACLQCLLQLHAERSNSDELLRLAAAGHELFSRPSSQGDAQAGQFYNTLAQIARRDNLADLRDNLHDLALLGLAGRVRQRTEESGAGRPPADHRAGNAVSNLFGSAAHWSPSLVRDADHAYRLALRRRTTAAAQRPTAPRIRTLRGRVTAVCAAPVTGDLFLGFDTGAVVGFLPRLGTQVPFAAYPGPIVSLSTDPEGEHVLMLRAGEDALHLSSAHRDGSVYRAGRWRSLEHPLNLVRPGAPLGPLPPRLSPLALLDGVLCTWLSAGSYLLRLWGSDFLPNGRVDLPFPAEEFCAAVILPEQEGPDRTLPAFVGEGGVWLPAPNRHQNGRWRRDPFRWVWSLPQQEGAPEERPGLIHPPVSLLTPSPGQLEITGLGPEGAILWYQTNLPQSGSGQMERKVPSGRFRATTLMQSGRPAGVTAEGVQWLAVSAAARFNVLGQTPTDLADAIACFPSPMTGELLVVCAEGDVVRVPVP